MTIFMPWAGRKYSPVRKGQRCFSSSTKQESRGDAEKRSGQLTEAMQPIAQRCFRGIPILVGTHGKRIVIGRLRNQALLWLVASYLRFLLFPFLNEWYAFAV